MATLCLTVLPAAVLDSAPAQAQAALVQTRQVQSLRQFCNAGAIGPLLGEQLLWELEAQPPTSLYITASEYEARSGGEPIRLMVALISYSRSHLEQLDEYDSAALRALMSNGTITATGSLRRRDRLSCPAMFQQSRTRPAWHSNLGSVVPYTSLFGLVQGYAFVSRPLLAYTFLPAEGDAAIASRPAPRGDGIPGGPGRTPPGPRIASPRPDGWRGPETPLPGRVPDVPAPSPDTAGPSPLSGGRGSRDDGRSPSVRIDEPRVATAERPSDSGRPPAREPTRPSISRPPPRSAMAPPEAAPPPIAPKRYPPPNYDVDALDPHVSTRLLVGESKAESVFAVETVECSEEGNWIVGYVGFMTTGADGADSIRIKQRFALNNYPGEGGIQLKELRARPHVTCDPGNVECSAPRRVVPLRDIVAARKRLEAAKAAGAEKEAGKVVAGSDKAGSDKPGVAATGDRPGDWRCRPDLGQCFSRDTDSWRCEPSTGRCHAIEPTRWWCVPRREFCYARVAFGDWGSEFGEDATIPIRHKIDLVYAMKDGFLPIAKHILKNHCSGPGKSTWSAGWRSAK